MKNAHLLNRTLIPRVPAFCLPSMLAMLTGLWHHMGMLQFIVNIQPVPLVGFTCPSNQRSCQADLSGAAYGVQACRCNRSYASLPRCGNDQDCACVAGLALYGSCLDWACLQEPGCCLQFGHMPLSATGITCLEWTVCRRTGVTKQHTPYASLRAIFAQPSVCQSH